MLSESSAQLVAHLEHPNGWWRDTAQKLLVLRADKSVVPALEKMARSSKLDLARMHALWTLEGIGALTPEFVREKFKDENASVRRAAIRASETLYKASQTDLEKDISAMAADSDPDVAIQSMLTAKLLKFPNYRELVAATADASSSNGVKAIGKMLRGGKSPIPPRMSNEQLAHFKKGKTIYASLCFSCHGADGKGMQVTDAQGKKQRMAPSFVNSKILNSHPDLAVKVVMHGMTGPIEGKTYPGEMIAMGSNGDEWVADVLSYVKNSFGNSSGYISKLDVERVRKETAGRKKPWTEAELKASVPQMIGNRGKWKLSASHKKGEAKLAIDGKLGTRYSTGESMKPGMWVQVELPNETNIAGVILDAAASSGDYPRGCEIELSNDGKSWSKPIKHKAKRSPKVVIEFPEQKARYVRITQTGKHRLFWSIHELNLLQAPKKK
jgi:mono/diheme cytochrome c family protein